mmetsp:Transcript_4549/g.5985  ORF Transcript_4549/g.5985 Transcript_4549/m.5985 type:complete len:185 (+) Transcript_4549:65-619(+)|eukprot:CAMPEP_0195268672 /NCGR_PEP_ID=MMETSP0706-20130129/13316_1 /TAXON_ID=33640 /ORGANISM="Asterionellopsis glacialis, Strain CCMP134" /LENGTH=184 /DNA_ID=CAMNT_0040323641 /DNA_START=65 /DNA_END=619 /DNA_ORIENTATION=-
MGNDYSTPQEQCEHAKNGFSCYLCEWAAWQQGRSTEAYCLYCTCLGDWYSYERNKSIRNDESPYGDGVGGACSIDLDCDDGFRCVELPDDLGSICVDPTKLDLDDFSKTVADYSSGKAEFEQSLMGGLNSGGNLTGSHSAPPVSAGFLVAGISMLALIVGLKKIRRVVDSKRGYEEVAPLVQQE